MAANHELDSSLAEGLEGISEEEQLQRLLEISIKETELLGALTNMSVDSTSSSTGGQESAAATSSAYEDWIRTPAEERLQRLAQPAEPERCGGQPGGAATKEPDLEEEAGDEEDQDSDTEEDEELRRVIEKSKQNQVMSEQEKTDLALELSRKSLTEGRQVEVEPELQTAIRRSLIQCTEGGTRSPAVIRHGTGSPRPTSLPCPSPRPAPQGRYSPLRLPSPVGSPGSAWPLPDSQLSEEEQVELAIQRSQEERPASMTEDEQLRLALEQSKAEAESWPSGPHRRRQNSAPSQPARPGPARPGVQLGSSPQHGTWSHCTTRQTGARPRSANPPTPRGKKRMIVVDGSNVAMAMGRHQSFRAEALTIVHEYFSKDGFEVIIFLPRSRYNKCWHDPREREILDTLERASILSITPSRKTDTQRWDSYDDRYIVQYAAKHKGIIVSNDNYRDLLEESEDYRDQIEKRVLSYTWIRDDFEPAPDPLGKRGPRLAEFLRFDE